MITTVSLTLKVFVVETAKYLHKQCGYDVTLICDNDEEFKIALNNYQNTYHYKICNTLEKDDIITLSNPLNLYIFSETSKFMGNIEVRGIFTASVLHNYFKNKSEEIDGIIL